MLRVVYCSSTAQDLGTTDMQAILRQARLKNKADGITGVLLADVDSFFQVLEGPAPAVRAAVARISRDPRHRGMMVVLEETCRERLFPDWSMGYVRACQIPDCADTLFKLTRKNVSDKMDKDDARHIMTLANAFMRVNGVMA